MRAVMCVAVASLVLACDEMTPTAVDAGAKPATKSASTSASANRVVEGCARTGSIEAIETDPACVLTHVNDDIVRDLSTRVSVDLQLDPPEVIAGSTAVLRLTITNVSNAEVLLVFDAHASAPGPRTDWSRLAGVPDVKGERPEVPRLYMNVSTADAHERAVDAVPVVANSAPPPSPPRLLGVRLRPGGKITHTLSWWALRIPAPAPIVKDDAGHRFVPKTTAVPLSTGEYVVSVDVPFHGLAPAERTVRVRAHVERIKMKIRKRH